MDAINVGLIGYGMAGSVFHAPLIASEPRLHLKSVVTSRAAQVTRENPGVEVVAEPEAIFKDPAVQLVVVATPNQTHFALARQALLAGKPVVVDKPFTITLAEADELVALAERKGLLLSVFHNRRWDGDFRTVRQLLAEELLGNISFFESRFNRFRPQIKRGWREEPGAGSGLYYDLAPHLIDQALTLFGLPQSVFLDVAHLRSQGSQDDYFHMLLDYEGLRAILHASNLVCHPGPRFTLHSESGSYIKFELDPQEQNLKDGIRPGMRSWGLAETRSNGTIFLADGSQHSVPTLPGTYEHYYAGIAEALLNGTPPMVTAQEARDVMLVLTAGLRSAYEQRTIRLRE
jgi:scyllo-inositol 2-dehydrogenase (NADP+)